MDEGHSRTGDLADRLREWAAGSRHDLATILALANEAATALDQAATRTARLEEELGRSRQTGYKSVLAIRGEPQRPDGTPLWPLRPDAAPAGLAPDQPEAPVPPARIQPSFASGDLPDWMR